jgi:aminopeptidase N
MFRHGCAALALASALGCGAMTTNCGGTTPPAETDRPVTTVQERDIHSFARPDEVRVTHVALDLRADFDARVLSGTATLTLQRTGPASQVVLDTRDLDIQRVAAAGDAPLKFTVGDVDTVLGRPLVV